MVSGDVNVEGLLAWLDTVCTPAGCRWALNAALSTCPLCSLVDGFMAWRGSVCLALVKPAARGLVKAALLPVHCVGPPWLPEWPHQPDRSQFSAHFDWRTCLQRRHTKTIHAHMWMYTHGDIQRSPRGFIMITAHYKNGLLLFPGLCKL